MKRMLPIMAMLACTICHAQISLLTTYGGNIATTILSSAGEKIYYNDTTTLHMFNMDNSVYKTITAPVYSGYVLSNVYAVSDNLFNSDNNVEYVAVYNNSSTGAYKSQVVSETGTVLQDLGTAYFGSVHYNSVSNNYELFAVTYAPPNFTTAVYSVPGTQPCGVCGSLGTERLTASAEVIQVSPPTPNPATDAARISYMLPVGDNAGTLMIYNVTGQVVKQVPVFSTSSYITVNTTTMQPGTYQYNINSNGTVSDTKTLVVQ